MILPAGGPTALLTESVGPAVADPPVQQLVLLAALLIAIGTLLAMRRSTTGLTTPLTERFVRGVPWGTLIVSGLLLAVYYGVQGGGNDPVVLPFRAWSYFDPVGMLLAGFAHAGENHLRANLIGTLLLGSLAEWWWGHYTERRTDSRWHALWTDPVARAVVIFPASTVVVGIVGTLVALGPIIGFSTVVFAFAGFALVRYPLVTVIISVGQGVVSTLTTAIRLPQQVATAGTSYSTPWFASIAVQGHAVGFLLGVLLGVGLLWYREESPPPAVDIWAGVMLFGVSKSLWAVYWFRGNETYVLYRAVGLALVFVLVAVVTTAVVARHEPLFPARAVPDPRTITASLGSITGREIGLLLLVGATAVVVGPAIPVNLTTAADDPLPGDPVAVSGYEITYAENVPDGQLSAIPIEAFGESTQLNTSGVIVRNTDRHIWSTDVPTSELASSGEATVQIGGVGWRESVDVNRSGWQTVGGESAYQVTLTHDTERRTVFASGVATTEPIVAGYRLSINATAEAFLIDAEPVEIDTDSEPNGTDSSSPTNTGNTTDTNGSDSTNATDSDSPNDDDSDAKIVLTDVPNASATVDAVAVPADGDSETLGPIRIVNRDDRLFAVHRGTVVRIAQKE